MFKVRIEWHFVIFHVDPIYRLQRLLIGQTVFSVVNREERIVNPFLTEFRLLNDPE